MKKLYEKNQLAFALVWIGIYCLVQSLANPLNELIGTEYIASAAFCFIQALLLFRFIRKNGLLTRYGLCKSTVPAARFVFYIPLILLSTTNFWNGVTLNMNAAGTVCYIICMFFVGFVEELIFRGFLFNALARENVKSAIIVSSISFGLGHLLNLVNGSGAELTENLFQVSGAIAIGFLFVIIYYRGGSLFPCIISHSVINVTSAFANETGLSAERRIVSHALLLVITLSYALLLSRLLPRSPESNAEK